MRTLAVLVREHPPTVHLLLVDPPVAGEGLADDRRGHRDVVEGSRRDILPFSLGSPNHHANSAAPSKSPAEGRATRNLMRCARSDGVIGRSTSRRRRRRSMPTPHNTHAHWADAVPTEVRSTTITSDTRWVSCIIASSSPKIRRRHRSSLIVQSVRFTFSHRLVAPPSYAALVLGHVALVPALDHLRPRLQAIGRQPPRWEDEGAPDHDVLEPRSAST
jgi:hypothetical protein